MRYLSSDFAIVTLINNERDKRRDMPKRWSKLQKRLYNLMEPSVNIQIHSALYEMNSNDGYHTYKLPRYFVTIGEDIVFDYPKDFDTKLNYDVNVYPWITEMSDISNIIEEYIERPVDRIMETFEGDKWGITDILRACDRRIGKRRLRKLLERDNKDVIGTIILRRLNAS